MGVAIARRSTFRIGVLAALVFATAVAVFARCVTFQFAYDDRWTIVDNRALEGRLAPLLRSVLTGNAALRHVPDSTRPLMVLSMWMDRRLFGLEPAGYHWHSLLLYGLTTVAAAVVVLAVTRRRFAALAGGLLFAVCPLHAEAVASINYREDLQAALAVFGVAACLLLPRRGTETASRAAYAAALAVLGLFGKESAVCVVLVVPALLLARRESLATWFASRRTSVFGVSSAVLLWGAYRALLRALGRDDVPLALEHRGALERVLRTCRYGVRTALDGLFPVSWSPEYAPEGPASWLWAVALAAVVVVILVLARRGRSGSVLAAGVLVALVAGLPTSPLVSPINETADRYAFVATLGGALFWGALFDRATRSLRASLRYASVALAVVPLAAVAQGAAAPWQSNDALWACAIERAPSSPRAWASWSNILRRRGDLDGAEQAALRGLAEGPQAFLPRVSRIYALLALGKTDEAKAAITELRSVGGGRMPGVRRAVRCAEMSQAEVAACLDPEAKPRVSAGSGIGVPVPPQATDGD